MTLEEKAIEYRKQLKEEIIANDDFERLDKFDENVEQAYLAGYKEALKMKVNTTTISDAPLMEREQLEQAKEIIRMVIDSYYHEERFQFERDLAKAEQFLKE